MIDKSNLCQLYLKHLYKDISGHQENNKSKKAVSETYGEILFESVNHLLSQLTLTNKDIFFDLGSGLGKVVIQVFLQSDVLEAYGIEIIPELFQCSSTIARRIQDDFPEFFVDERKLQFIQGDFLEVSFEQASIVLIASPLFTPQSLYSLGKLIDINTKIHTVISLRPILSLTRLTVSKVMRIEGSWDSALCYLYTL